MSLFQTAPRGRRLIRLWAAVAKGSPPAAQGGPAAPDAGGPWRLFAFVRRVLRRRARIETGSAADDADEAPIAPQCALCLALREVAMLYQEPLQRGAFIGALLALAWSVGDGWRALLLATLLTTVLGAVAGLLVALAGDIQCGLIANGFGLCKGGTLDAPVGDDRRPGLCEWLHEGIQRQCRAQGQRPPAELSRLVDRAAVPRRRADTLHRSRPAVKARDRPAGLHH